MSFDVTQELLNKWSFTG